MKAYKCEGCQGFEEGDPPIIMMMADNNGFAYMTNTKLPQFKGADMCTGCAQAIALALANRRTERGLKR